MQGFDIKFRVYAETQEEVEEAQKVIQSFVNEHAKEGRAVTAKKLSDVIPKWKENFLIKKQIIKYFE